MKAESSRFKVKILMTPHPVAKSGAIWMFYGFSRARYIGEHPELYGDRFGLQVPRFEEEVAGRFMLADGVKNALEQGESISDRYLSDLLGIYKAGFLSEYVWWFLNHPSWPASCRPPALLLFIAWAQKELEGHTVETYGGIELEPMSGIQPPSGRCISPPLDACHAGGEALRPQLDGISQSLRLGNWTKTLALLEDFDSAASELRTDRSARYVCFRSHHEMNFFLEMNPEVRVMRVLDWCVAEAKRMQAFVFSQMRRFSEALTALEQLQRLAPTLSSAYGEQGYILNQLGQAQHAESAYGRAWDLASRLPENSGMIASSLRGLGVTAVQSGDLESAETWLHDSMIIEPDSLVALQELDYFSRIRREPWLRSRIHTT